MKMSNCQEFHQEKCKTTSIIIFNKQIKSKTIEQSEEPE